jgi:hypothetical protein
MQAGFRSRAGSGTPNSQNLAILGAKDPYPSTKPSTVGFSPASQGESHTCKPQESQRKSAKDTKKEDLLSALLSDLCGVFFAIFAVKSSPRHKRKGPSFRQSPKHSSLYTRAIST